MRMEFPQTCQVKHARNAILQLAAKMIWKHVHELYQTSDRGNISIRDNISFKMMTITRKFSDVKVNAKYKMRTIAKEICSKE